MGFLSLLFLLIGTVSNNRHALQSHLFNKPVSLIPDDGINLTLSLAIRAFNYIDQIDGSINMNVWLRYNWNSDIKWNSSNFNDISSINLNTNPEADNFIWTPDIYLYNTAEKPMNELDYTKANVYSDGNIFWSRPGLIKSTCVFNLTYFPFDQQTCKLKFGSWTHDMSYIYMNDVQNNSIDISNYQEHEEWNLVDFYTIKNSVIYSCCKNPYHDLEFYYTIRRKQAYYNLNIIIPTFATATLIILTLLVPWDSGERISFAVTVLLSIIVFLLIVSENLPKTDSKPLLSLMIIGLIYFSLVGVIFTILISCIHESIKNDTIKDNKIMVYLFSKCKYIKCCINTEQKKIVKHNSEISMTSIKTNSSLSTDNSSIYSISPIEYIEPVLNKVNKLNLEINNKENINITTNIIDLEECKKLTIKIEKIFILTFLLSFIIYCLIIFLSVPKY
jgi:hypothetical protein